MLFRCRPATFAVWGVATAAAIFLSTPTLPALGASLATYEFGKSDSDLTATSEGTPAHAPTFAAAGVQVTPVRDPTDAVALEIAALPTRPDRWPYLRVVPGAGALTPAGSLGAGKYFEFSITPDAGTAVDLTSLTFNAAKGGSTGTRGFFVRSSADAYAGTLAALGAPTALVANDVGYNLATGRPTYTAVTIDLSAPAFQNLTPGTPLTFRFFTFASTSGNSVDIDDLSINGTVVVGTPDPSALLLPAAAAGPALLGRRRRRPQR